MSLEYPTTPPPAALSTDNEDAADRTALVERYNGCVGQPKKITRTIQKQFVMGFMSKDEIASLRSMYLCVIAAVEATAGTGIGGIAGQGRV